MLFRQRFAVPLVRDEHVVVHADLEWIVRRVTVVALEEDVCGLGLRLHKVGDGEKRHPLPFHVELGPGGDAMKVAYVFELRQREELLPVQRDRVLYEAVDFQLPFVERDFRLKAQVEHGEIVHLPLAGREPVRRARGRTGFARHFPRPTFFGGDVLVFQSISGSPRAPCQTRRTSAIRSRCLIR